MHSKNYLHRDIKPDNFVLGLGDKSSSIYILDFGLSMLYINPLKGNHIPYNIGKSLTGTARYASISSHLGYEQSRRDDLECIFYVTLYFLRGSLPWQNISAETKQEKYKLILNSKRENSIESLCAGFPGTFINIL